MSNHYEYYIHNACVNHARNIRRSTKYLYFARFAVVNARAVVVVVVGKTSIRPFITAGEFFFVDILFLLFFTV